MPETHVVEFQIADEMIEPAVRAVLASRKLKPPGSPRDRFIGWLGVAILVALAVFYLVFPGCWWAPLVFLLLAAGVALVQFVDSRLYRMRVDFAENVRQLAGGTIRWTLEEAGALLESPFGPRHVRWPDVRDVFLGHGFYVVTERKGRTTLLPEDRVSQPAERFLLDKVTQAGGTVRTSDGLQTDYDDRPSS